VQGILIPGDFPGKAKMTGMQEKQGRSIQSRLILLLLFILIPVLAVQAYMYYDNYQTRKASELQANLEVARAVAKAFESFVQDVVHHELVIGRAITSSSMTSQDISRFLLSSQGFAVRDFTWMNPAGDAVYSGNPAVAGKNYSDRSYFREVANGREWMVGELIISKASGKPVFGISRGIRDEKGTLLGVVVAVIIPEELDSRLGVERSKGGGHALVDHKGMLVYRYPAIHATWEERNWLKDYPEFGEALRGKEIATTVYAPYEGKNRLVGLTPVSSIGWAAGAGKREEEVTGPILISMANNALLFLSVSLAAFFIALAVSRKITNPVRALRAHALALGQGEKPEPVRISHDLELQDLADTFNIMAEKVQAREMELRASEEALRQANEHLEQRVRERTMDLENLMEQIEKSRGDLRKLASEIVMAEERERKRIAGVLHDEVAQTLAAARIRIDMLQSIPSDPKDMQTLEETKALIAQSIQETRVLMTEVSNPLLFDMGLQAACGSLADRLMKIHPIRIRCDVRDAYKHVNPDVKTILYQVFRELLNNVVKHSKAQNAHVMIDMENGHFRVKVTDDGLGFDTKMLGAPTVEGGFGLYSIRERLIAIGGSLMIDSAPGSGTVVTAILPAALE
jgi:signal transduction histidine kinase